MTVGYIRVLVVALWIDNVSTMNRTGNCHFKLTDMKVRDDLNQALEAGSKLIKFHIKFKGYPEDILKLKGGAAAIFRPTIWFRTTKRHGKSLLKLDDNFEVLSLSLLGIGVTDINVTLIEKPYGCMNDLTTGERVNKTRQLLLRDFKMSEPDEEGGMLRKHDNICNMRMKSSDDYASFVYFCCHMSPDEMMICQDIEDDVWINVLLVCVTFFKVLVFLFSPSFIPEKFYRKKLTPTYIYKFRENITERIRVKKTRNTNRDTQNVVPIKYLDGFDSFKGILENMEEDQIYGIKLDRIRLSVKSRELLPENYAPVSIPKMIYENVMRCQSKGIPTTKTCCLRIFARLILAGLLTIPWILRLFIYFRFEATNVEDKRKAAGNLKFDMNVFRGSFTLYQTPLHEFFFVIYIVWLFVWCAYGLFNKSMKNRLLFIPKKCLNDMRERPLLSVYSWAAELFVYPTRVVTSPRCLILPLYWLCLIPCILPILVFYTFPAINFSIRLIIHLFIFMCPQRVANCCKATPVKKFIAKHLKLGDLQEEFKGKEGLNKKEICINILIIIFCFISFWCLAFLLMECLSFYMEVGVYILMGVIVNADVTLEYVSLLVIICTYINDCFGAKSKIYLDYHKKILDLLVGRNCDEMNQADISDNMVFPVGGTNSVVVEGGQICWKTKGLIVFLNEKKQPFTPEKFFFETLDMNYYGCPGKVWKNTLVALCEFMKIMIFLVFVIIVVFMFGNELSTTEQMLATTVGGLVPLFFKLTFMERSPDMAVNTENVMFVKELDKVLENYEETWPVADIDVSVESSEEGGPDTNSNTRDLHDEHVASSSLLEADTVHISVDEASGNSVTDTEVDFIVDVSQYDQCCFHL